MQGEDLAEMIVVAMDHMMHERENTTCLDWAIESSVRTTSWLKEKDVSCNIEAFKAKCQRMAFSKRGN